MNQANQSVMKDGSKRRGKAQFGIVLDATELCGESEEPLTFDILIKDLWATLKEGGDEYNFSWRCWEARPTDEEMKNAKWLEYNPLL